MAEREAALTSKEKGCLVFLSNGMHVTLLEEFVYDTSERVGNVFKGG